jgi:hypothetical protein
MMSDHPHHPDPNLRQTPPTAGPLVGAHPYDRSMPDAFTVLWTQDTCRALREHDRVGKQPPVAFGGIHQSLPTWTGARPGDEVYALHVNRRVVHVVSRMRIVDLDRGECCGPAPVHWISHRASRAGVRGLMSRTA